MAVFYNIVFFTAGEKKYAETMRDMIDPNGEFCKALLSRENCAKTKNRVC